MPCISGNFGPAGVLLQVAILPADSDVAKATADRKGPDVTLFPALVDTGANCTCNTPTVVAAVGLSPIGKREMISASHVVSTNNYLFNLGLPTDLSQQPTGQVSGNLTLFEGINGMEFSAGPAQFHVLLGMDVLRRGVLSISFDGRFVFCW